MRHIIAIHGKLESGKSTAADYLCKHLQAVIKPFAKPIKDFAFSLGWDGNKDTKGRRLLQLLGTEVGRECISDDIWIEKWQESLDNTGSNVTIICDDLRFQNEYEHLVTLSENMPVTIIHVVRPADTSVISKLLTWCLPSASKGHKSEQGIDFNGTIKPLVIYNSGTVSQLHFELDRIMDEYI